MKKQAGKKNNIISILALLFSSLFILAGCGSGSSGDSGSSGGSGTTPVSIRLNIPDSGISAAESSFSGVVTQSAPTVVSSITIEITGSGMDPIIDTFNVLPGETLTKTYDVPSGPNRTIVARAYSGPMGTGKLLYEGSTTVSDLSGESVAVSLNMVLSDITEALNVLNSGDIVGAHDLFRAAALKYAGGGSNNEDTANFFYALTRVLAPWFDMQFDDDIDDSLYDIGVIVDIINTLSCSENVDCNTELNSVNGTVEAYFTAIVCSENLPSGFPAGQELHDFLFNVLRPEIAGSIANLDNVTESFKERWTEYLDNTEVESDYGDVLFLRAVLNTAMAELEIQDANAKSEFLLSALDDIKEAIDWISKEGGPETDSDDQADDWINLVDKDPLEMLGILNDIETARECNEPLDG